MQRIGKNHGAEILRQRLHELDPDTPDEPNFAIDTVLGEPGKVYDPDYPGKVAAGTLRRLVADHDELVDARVLDRLAALEDAVATRPFG